MGDIMLIISKKKLKIWRSIMLCGIIVFLIGGAMAIGLHSGSIVIAIIGILIALVGAKGVDSLYRCPRCGKKLLADGDRGSFSGECPKYCPHCSSEIDIVETK